MGKNKKYYLNVIFMAVLLAAVFYVLLKDQDLNDILNAMRGAKKFDMILSMFAALVYVIMEGVSMQIIITLARFQETGTKMCKIFVYRIFLLCDNTVGIRWAAHAGILYA